MKVKVKVYRTGVEGVLLQVGAHEARQSYLDRYIDLPNHETHVT